MHKYEIAVLEALNSRKAMKLDEVMQRARLNKDETLWAAENLSSNAYIELKKSVREEVEISEEGRHYILTHLPEEKLLDMLSNGEISVGRLGGREDQIGLQWLKKKNLVLISMGVVRLTGKGGEALEKGIEEGIVLRSLYKDLGRYKELYTQRKEAVENLIKRGLIIKREGSEIESIRITEKGVDELKHAIRNEEIDSLNKNIIVNRLWSGKGFKQYDVTIPVEMEPVAVRHPLRRLIGEMEQSHVALGFEEVSGPIIEPSFWVFDNLFMPQDHPARELQDTFYLSNPERLSIEDDNALRRVRKAHTESWKSEWSEEVAEMATLRTHTTSVTGRCINKIVSGILSNKIEYELPVKLFNIGRVFRNENIDYKHLTDFYHADGIVIGKSLTLAHLFGVLINIYGAFGIKVKFKPAYFPFVEPGVEVYAYFSYRKEWIEMGGAGLIRSEVTGVPRKNISVLAWGLSVERLLLLKDPNLSRITELYNNGIGWLRRRKGV